MGKAIRAENELGLALGRKPTTAEIAQKAGIALDRLIEILERTQPSVSLETPVGEDGETPLGDLVPDHDSSLDPAEAVIRGVFGPQIKKEELKIAMKLVLTGKEQRVLELRYGLDDDTPRTLDQIGQELNLTRERIRQIERDALGKIRRSRAGQKLRYFLA